MTSHYAYTPAIWMPLGTVLLLLALAAYSWGQRRVPGAMSFAFALFFTALWALGSLLEYAALDLATKIAWIKFQAVWQVPAATAVTCYILEYTWPGRWVTRRSLTLLSIPPLLIALLVLSNDLHHLMWRGFVFDRTVTPLIGPASWVAIAYGYGFVLVNFIVFTWLFRRSPQHRWFVVIMVAGQVVIRVVYLLERTLVPRLDLPLDVLGITFAYLMYALALFRFHILSPIPFAQQTVIAQMRDGMLVLDLAGRVTSLNPAAERIVGVPARQAMHRPIRDLLPAYPEVHLDGGEAEIELLLGTGTTARRYTLTASSLYDWRGLAVGRLLLLRDVTDQRKAQAQLVEQQRALAMLHERELLARELHDGIGQVLGYVKMQAQATRDQLAQDHKENLDRQLAQLAVVAQDAHADVREYLLGVKTGAPEAPGFILTLRQYLTRFSEHYPLRTELSAPPDWNDELLEATVSVQLLRIIQEALSNARKHAQAHNVHVRLEVDDSRVLVTVQDDGAGFDADRNREGTADHYGLKFMRERAEQVGGFLIIDGRPGAGTRVVIEVPVQEIRGTIEAETW